MAPLLHYVCLDSGDEASSSQPKVHVATSKDLTHLARLSGNLHIFITAMQHVLDKPARDATFSIPGEIPLKVLKMAHKLYMNALRQKTIFTEVLVSWA